jgi:hypothetical protein
MFSPFSWQGSLIRDSDGYKRMNKQLAMEMKHLSRGDPVGEHGGGGAHVPGTLREKWINKECVKESSGDGFISPLGPVGESGG